MPEIGAVSVGGTSPESIAEIDTNWPPNRRPSDVHQTWLWSEIAPNLCDAFIVYGSTGLPLAIWGSTKCAPITLPEGRFYRLDFFEVTPTLRGVGSSVAATFALAAIATRALELGASGIVLAAFPVEGLGRSYESRGAVQRSPKGWDFPSNLVPYLFDLEALKRLEGFADELLEIDEAK